MTVSGTTAFAPQIREIIEEAYERAGREIRSGYELRTAIRSLNFVLASWANKGLNLWTIEEQFFTCIIGQDTYELNSDMGEDPSSLVDVIEAVVRLPPTGQQTDISLERLTVSEYAQIVSKTSPGRPIQYYCQRLVDRIEMTLWLVPDQNYEIHYWAMRRMDDAGGVNNTPDIPFRFLEALTAELAYRVAVKTPQAMERVPYLKQMSDEAWDLAAGEDRDRSSFYFLPDVCWPR